MMKISSLLGLTILLLHDVIHGFMLNQQQSCYQSVPIVLVGEGARCHGRVNCALAAESSSSSSDNNNKQDNKAMAFLRKIGRVGGGASFTNAMGIDEGPAGKRTTTPSLRKSKSHFLKSSSVETGIIDDMTEQFPLSTSGTLWSGFTDRVMGGVSVGHVSRETSYHGRPANVLRGQVRLDNNGGFIQMATNLSPDHSSAVDASLYDGIQLHVQSPQCESFNVHLKTNVCTRPFSSYRATFTINQGNTWEVVRLPWNAFQGKGPGASEEPFNSSRLIRAGIVAIGKEMNVELAVSDIRFYKD